MSAVLPGAPDKSDLYYTSLGPDGIRRYKTRCKVIVDSHNASEDGTIELFDDVIEVETSKTIKGAGQASVVLTPSKNYLNLIFPNDYINIYFDIGDGSGWTRTFFGYVDRIEESYLVDKTGNPTTNYRLICTDFYKAFDRTVVYFNPHLAGRDDFINYDFSAINIGGLALMTKGIVAGGTPADVVTNIIQLLIGFGTQFILPKSYQPGRVQEDLRKARARLAAGQLGSDSLAKIGGIGENYKILRDKANAEAANTVSGTEMGLQYSEEDRTVKLAEELGLSSKDVALALGSPKSQEKLIQLVSTQIIKDELTLNTSERGLVGTDESQKNAVVHLYDSTIQEDSSLSDIIDTFTFVERRAIDGYLFGQPVWQAQGSLASILRSYSNESVNELFFDLRPISAAGRLDNPAGEVLEGAYSVAADDKRGNVDKDTSQGIFYLPSLVMREYPFSTIEGLNLSKVNLLLKDEKGDDEAIGLLYFGAIFNDGPNIPGRHVIQQENINIGDIANGNTQHKGSKHLDVAVISEEEVKSSTLGRSDNDHFNLFEYYSDNVLGSDQKFYMRDFLPIITPIQLLRNGIRVRSVTTRAARFSIEAIRNLKSVDFEKAMEDAAEKKDPFERPVTNPILMSSPVLDPLNVVSYRDGNDQANWGYRKKDKLGAWVFHQGIDIYKKQLNNIPEDNRDKDIAIVAIADGEIVISAPEGCYEGYGKIIVIKHKFENIGIRYSVYAHLSRRAMGFGVGVLKGRKTNLPIFAAKDKAPGIARGSKPGIPVKQGEVIGYMGNTGFEARPGEKFHLHFEIDRHFPPRNDKITKRVPFTEISGRPIPPTDFDLSGMDTAKMVAAKQNSCDPILFYHANSLDLQKDINKGGSGEPLFTPVEPDDIDLGSNSEEEISQRPKEDVYAEKGIPFREEGVNPISDRTLVDTASSRKQLIRWALLQDHWYQHNLEYLSGRIDMRGAPEIRVGYRLDIKERNMSFYVEGVNHKWRFPNNMDTNLAVSRGQPNNPYPLYVYPNSSQMKVPSSQRRKSTSRLATYFITPDPVAIRRSLFIRNGASTEGGSASLAAYREGINVVDSVDYINFDADDGLSALYNERVVPAGSNEVARAKNALAEEEAANKAVDKEEANKLAPVTNLDSRGATDKEDPLEKN